MDGVLVDTMPFHYEAMKTAVDEIANIQSLHCSSDSIFFVLSVVRIAIQIPLGPEMMSNLVH